MIRLFVGIEPPQPVKQQLVTLMGGIAGARWQHYQQLHLTLRFIGEVDRHTANDVLVALDRLTHPSFEAFVHGTGVFEKRLLPHTLWAGVEPEASFRALHNKVDQALRLAGIDQDQRQFKPHITLARLNQQSGPLHGFLEAHGGLRSASFTVDSLCLYESRLTSAGSVYEIIERYPLKTPVRSMSGSKAWTKPATPALTSNQVRAKSFAVP